MGGRVSPGRRASKIDSEVEEAAKEKAKSTEKEAVDSSSNAEVRPAPDEFFGLDVPFSDLVMIEAIGHGTYGKVFRGKCRGKTVAIKKLFMSNEPDERAEILEDFAKEVKILGILKHECICNFHGAVRSDPDFCLIFELCEGSVGSLLETARRNQAMVTWRICIKIALDCAKAMVYLHGLTPKIIHRDLKAENLLLDDKFNCKLTDFGLSRGYEAKSVMTVCGTPCWVAPEIFRGDAYTETVDVYSYAVVLWELFAFEKPYADQDGAELPYLVAKEGLRPPLLKHVPTQINDLMNESWHPDMTQRPPFTDIVKSLEAIEKECNEFLDEPIDPTKNNPPK